MKKNVAATLKEQIMKDRRRRALILKMIAQDIPLEAIAAHFLISIQRVHQLLGWHNLSAMLPSAK